MNSANVLLAILLNLYPMDTVVAGAIAPFIRLKHTSNGGFPSIRFKNCCNMTICIAATFTQDSYNCGMLFLCCLCMSI